MNACKLNWARAACLATTVALASCDDDPPGTSRSDGPSPIVSGSDASIVPGEPLPNDAGSAVGSSLGDGAAAPGASASDASSVPQVESAWCAIKPLTDQYCAVCHDGKGTSGSPMPLLTQADFAADSVQYPGSKIYQRASVRMHAATSRMPPQQVIAAADLSALDAWIASGAPAGGSTDCGTKTGDAGVVVQPEWPADCEEHHEFRAHGLAGGPFTVGAGREFYQDFTFDAPWSDGDVQAVAFRSITDNSRVLHHWILYQGTSSFLVGWSPGKNEKTLPADVGVYMPGRGNSLKLTVHYFNSQPGAKSETDTSGVEVCVTRKPRPKTAFTFPFAAVPSVPANAPMTTNTATCTVHSQSGVHLITSSPHMHRRGVYAKLEIMRRGGGNEVVHDAAFDFEEQTTRPIDVQLNDGDRVRTTCVYANSGGAGTGFGTSTEQEMCFNFALYYPICGMTCTGDLLADGIARTQGSGCPSGFGL